MTIQDIEENLGFALERLSRAVQAMAPEHKGGEQEEFEAARNAVVSLERELASAKGKPYAIPLQFPVRWDVGAPLPHLIASDYQTFLTFYVDQPDPNWDGTFITVKSPGNGSTEQLALVEFTNCASVKIGTPDDEVQHGHPLDGHGLEGYTAQIVENSPWLAELEAINKVHSGYRKERWRRLKHYVFWFHDSTFECVAEGFTVEVFQENMAALLSRISGR